VFKDAKVVIFYSNDLNGTPTEAIMDGSCELAQSICHGVSHVHRWTGVEIMKWTAFLVPAPIVAYNLFMNGVDKMDQLQSTNMTRCREKQLYMTIFMMFLDLAVHQAYCIYQAVVTNTADRKHNNLISFKKKIISDLLEGQLQRREDEQHELVQHSLAHRLTLPPTARLIVDTLGGINEQHMLVKNVGRKKNANKPQDVPCYLCKLRNMYKTTIYGCPTCQLAFHVECFTAFHYKDALKGNVKALVTTLKTIEVKGKGRKKKSTKLGSLETLTLPMEDSNPNSYCNRKRRLHSSL